MRSPTHLPTAACLAIVIAGFLGLPPGAFAEDTSDPYRHLAILTPPWEVPTPDPAGDSPEDVLADPTAWRSGYGVSRSDGQMHVVSVQGVPAETQLQSTFHLAEPALEVEFSFSYNPILLQNATTDYPLPAFELSGELHSEACGTPCDAATRTNDPADPALRPPFGGGRRIDIQMTGAGGAPIPAGDITLTVRLVVFPGGTQSLLGPGHARVDLQAFASWVNWTSSPPSPEPFEMVQWKDVSPKDRGESLLPVGGIQTSRATGTFADPETRVLHVSSAAGEHEEAALFAWSGTGVWAERIEFEATFHIREVRNVTLADGGPALRLSIVYRDSWLGDVRVEATDLTPGSQTFHLTYQLPYDGLLRPGRYGITASLEAFPTQPDPVLLGFGLPDPDAALQVEADVVVERATMLVIPSTRTLADLTVSLALEPSPVIEDRPVAARVTVTNQGESGVAMPILSISPNKWLGCTPPPPGIDCGTWSASVELGPMLAGESRTVPLLPLVFNTPGVYFLNARVDGYGPADYETNYDNNGAGGDFEVVANQIPVADAGPDLLVAEATVVGLDASRSTDGNGDALAYAWTQVAGPAVALDDSTAMRPSFTAPEVPLPGNVTLRFRLVASDVSAASAPDLVDVTVAHVNRAPVADIVAPASAKKSATVTFDGTGSTDSDGTITSYAWDFGDGKSAAGATVSHKFIRTGEYHVTLTVTDDVGAQGTATWTIRIGGA